MFVDKANIKVQGGNGGNGAVAFRREKYVPDGGPSGGNGGKGGDVLFVADNNLRTLMDFKYKPVYKAQSGEDGKKSNMNGKNGKDLIVKVPVGTVIKEKKSGKIIADLKESGQEKIVAKGGRGGRGNSNFKTSVRQAPTFAKAGIHGERLEVTLELKLIADVGLVGFPNVGKSTFLSVVTKAKPKIADYHFTTLVPNLGVVVPKYGSSFVIADIPGIIEGASEGVGLGYDFLRHIQRTKILLHIVDISGSEGRKPLEDYSKINKELTAFDSRLKDKKQVVVANKSDALQDKRVYEEFKTKVEKDGRKVFLISAVTQKGIDEILEYLSKELENMEDIELYDKEDYFTGQYEGIDEEEIDIYEEDGVYYVQGNKIDRLLYSVDFKSLESAAYFQNAMEKLGVYHRLREMGINQGDLVSLSGYEFEFYD